MCQDNLLLLVDLGSGIFCPRGGFTIDPTRSVARAVITHAHSDHARPGSGEYICTPETAALIRLRIGERIRIKEVEYGASFRMGEVDVSLHPAGHMLGSAQIRVGHAGQTWVVSGDYKRQDDPTCRPFESVACDVFISEATFGLPFYRWPNLGVSLDEISQWILMNHLDDKIPAISCYSLGKAQRLLHHLTTLGFQVAVSANIAQGNTVYRSCGILLSDAPVVEALAPAELQGTVVLAQPQVFLLPRFAEVRSHLRWGNTSGWMATSAQRKKVAPARGFTLSDHADWDGLLTSIRETKARQVLLTHGRTDVLAGYLQETGIYARPLRE